MKFSDPELRVIGPDNAQLGIMSLAQAMRMAEELNLDLVKIADGQAPVCRIMDYGKYRFEAAKEGEEVRKNQKVITIREVRLSATIEEHDMQVKLKKCREAF